MRILCALLFLAIVSKASQGVVERAMALYQQTQYENSLRVLEQDPAPDYATRLLIGRNEYMLGDYKKAVDALEKAVALSPNCSDCELWLGRAWGRRAETGSRLFAAMYASRTRQAFEKAVALDPRNHEAKNDLFDYYLNAPGFLGGGTDKAEALAKTVANERPAEYQFEEAQLAEKRRDYASEEAHLKRAIELAPDQPGRIVELARFLAKRGRMRESDQTFERARKTAPDRPALAFSEASTYIEYHRNLPEARELLQGYLKARLTPDDPSRQDAEKLLQRAGG